MIMEHESTIDELKDKTTNLRKERIDYEDKYKLALMSSDRKSIELEVMEQTNQHIHMER